MILSGNYKDYILVDIYDVTIVDKETDEIIVLNRLTKCDLSMSASSTEVRGGKANALISTLNGDKKLEVALDYPVFNYEMLALSLGTDIAVGSGEKFVTETLTVKSNKVSVKETPIANSIKIYDGTGKITGTATAKDITLTGKQDGDIVKVVYKTAFTGSDRLNISAKKFPKSVYMQMSTNLIDAEENDICDVVITLPSVKLKADFALNTTSERNANAQSLTFDVLADSNGELGTIDFIEVNEA